jgi:hypothetical protein
MKPLMIVVLLAATSAPAQTFTLLGTGGKSITTWHGQADAHSVALEWSNPQTPVLELGLSIQPWMLWQPRSWFGDQFGDGNEQVRAFSASFLARRHFGQRNVRPYVELLVGPMWAERQVPASTSRFNVVTQPGAGVTFGAAKRVAPVVGFRFAHISNGGYAPRNPGLNVSEVVLGLRVK